MSVTQRLDQVFEEAKLIEFDNASRFIIFSDCHRGDNSWADDFAHNQVIFFHAMQYYLQKDFTYIEAGDGNEL